VWVTIVLPLTTRVVVVVVTPEALVVATEWPTAGPLDAAVPAVPVVPAVPTEPVPPDAGAVAGTA
jgi:hypothetical protein